MLTLPVELREDYMQSFGELPELFFRSLFAAKVNQAIWDVEKQIAVYSYELHIPSRLPWDLLPVSFVPAALLISLTILFF